MDELFFLAEDNTTVQIAQIRHVLVTKLCTLQFTYFPFDKQTCNFLIRSTLPSSVVYLTGYSNLRIKPNAMTRFSMELRDIEEDRSRNLKVNREEFYRFLGFKMKLWRNSKPYIFSYYIPVGTMALVASISFWIPPDSIPGRMGLLITLALTMINYFNGIQVSI